MNILKLAEESRLDLFPGWVHCGRGYENLTKYTDLVREEIKREVIGVVSQYRHKMDAGVDNIIAAIEVM